MNISEREKEVLRINIQRVLFKKSYYEYFCYTVQQLEPSVTWHIGWYHKYLADILQREAERIVAGQPKTSDYCISIPPRSSKSLLFNSVFVSWCWLFYPMLKFMRISYSDELSTTLSYQTKIIFDLPFYKRLNDSFKIRPDVNSKSLYSNDKMGSSYSAGLLASLTGFGADFIIIDDAAKAQAIGELARKTVIDQYKNTIYNRLNDPKVGVRFIIGQRIHNQDLIGYLMETSPENYFQVNLPATISANVKPCELQNHYENQGGLLLPALFDLDVLAEYRKGMGSYGYSAQYEMSPIPIGGGILKYDDIQSTDWRPEFKDLTWHMVVDSAFGKTKSDMSAVLIAAKWHNSLIIRMSRQFNQEFPDLLNSIKAMHADYLDSRSRVYIEGKGSGQSIVQSLRRETRFNIHEINSGRDDKITRCHAIAPISEAKRIYVINDDEGKIWNQNFLDEVCNFPLATYDDQTDCLMYAVEHVLNRNTTVTYINQRHHARS